MDRAEVDRAFSPGTYDKMVRVLERFPKTSIIWLVTLHSQGTEQTVYVITPVWRTALTLAKAHSELVEPKLKSAHRHVLSELEPAETAMFSDKGIAVFEPEAEEQVR